MSRIAENNSQIQKFLEALHVLCRHYNITISHEDKHGAFIFERYDPKNINWLRDGIDETKK